jgi:predicted transcriptional regulator
VKIKMSVALEPDLDERVRESADRSGKTLSTWITEAAKAKLLVELGEEAELQRKMRGLDAYLDEYEAEHGAFTEEELARASRKLGLPWPPDDGGTPNRTPKGEIA